MIATLLNLICQTVLVAHWLHSEKLLQNYRELVALLQERIREDDQKVDQK